MQAAVYPFCVVTAIMTGSFQTGKSQMPAPSSLDMNLFFWWWYYVDLFSLKSFNRQSWIQLRGLQMVPRLNVLFFLCIYFFCSHTSQYNRNILSKAFVVKTIKSTPRKCWCSCNISILKNTGNTVSSFRLKGAQLFFGLVIIWCFVYRYMLTQPDRFDVALLHLDRPVFYQAPI
jgi:hypothetical protein